MSPKAIDFVKIDVLYNAIVTIPRNFAIVREYDIIFYWMIEDSVRV
jgi:hypothetical protein